MYRFLEPARGVRDFLFPLTKLRLINPVYGPAPDHGMILYGPSYVAEVSLVVSYCTAVQWTRTQYRTAASGRRQSTVRLLWFTWDDSRKRKYTTGSDSISTRILFQSQETGEKKKWRENGKKNHRARNPKNAMHVSCSRSAYGYGIVARNFFPSGRGRRSPKFLEKKCFYTTGVLLSIIILYRLYFEAKLPSSINIPSSASQT